MCNDSYLAVAPDVALGRDVKLAKFINLYGCQIGDETRIGAFVEVQKNAKIGKRCKISSHTFICEGVTIQDNVFIGHGVTFINDPYPRAILESGELQTEADWKVQPTLVKKGASIGSGATILANVTIGESAIVGAGSTVTKDVPANTIVAGNPARMLRRLAPRSSEGPTSLLIADSKNMHALSSPSADSAEQSMINREPEHKRVASAAPERPVS